MNLEQKIDEIEVRLRAESEIIAEWDGHETLHSKCSDEVKVDGLWMEFGVFTGRSIEQLSRKCPTKIYGFDSFEGLPEQWDNDNPKGCYNLGGEIPPGYIIGENHSMFDSNMPTNYLPWPENVELVKGMIEDTLPEFLKYNQETVAFIHIDTDLYSSAVTILNNLETRIKKGTIILFDEINDYPDYREHEIKAFAEFLIDTGLEYTPLIHQNLGYSQGCFRIE
tara:strand:+ start:353 stop:1021 length:669 start_codon:yes stop_codon:yes gene_type:complete